MTGGFKTFLYTVFMKLNLEENCRNALIYHALASFGFRSPRFILVPSFKAYENAKFHQQSYCHETLSHSVLSFEVLLLRCHKPGYYRLAANQEVSNLAFISTTTAKG